MDQINHGINEAEADEDLSLNEDTYIYIIFEHFPVGIPMHIFELDCVSEYLL